MKCPKCAYLSLDSGDRCGHCGYEFALLDVVPPEPRPGGRPRATPLNAPSRPRPDAGAAALRPTPRDLHASGEGALGRPLNGPDDGAPLDLPLFDADRAPLPPPHRPLGVRRAGHVTPRPRVVSGRPSAGVLPLEPEPLRPETGAAVTPDDTYAPADSPAAMVPARTWRRVGAAIIDACTVLLVDLCAAYFTLRVAGLQPAEWDLLPLLPLATFFVVLNGGYVVLLTGTLGQTLGKMALEVEVVAEGRPSVGVARATLRTALAVLSLAPAGLGLVWTFWGDGRPLHDRLARTRVVSSSV